MKRSLLVVLCSIIVGAQLQAVVPAGYAEFLHSEKPIAWTYDFVKDHATTIDIEALIAQLDGTVDRKIRWYATLTLAVLGECHGHLIAPYLSRWGEQVSFVNTDKIFPEYTAPDGSHFINLQEIGTEGGLGYFKQPALTLGRACKTITVMKDGKAINVEETWVILAGSGELALRNKIVEGQEHVDWNVISLVPGKVVHIPFGVPFQFRSGKDGFLAHDLTLPPWPGAQAADNTVEGLWTV